MLPLYPEKILLTCIREHMEKLNSVPKDISTLRNSVESSQGDVNVVGTHCVAMKTDVDSMAGDIRNSASEVNSIKTHGIEGGFARVGQKCS